MEDDEDVGVDRAEVDRMLGIMSELDDTDFEPDETFFLQLLNDSLDGTLGDADSERDLAVVRLFAERFT